MEPVTIEQARAKLGDLVLAASRGQATPITRYGRPAAVIGPVPPTRDEDKPVDITQALRTRADALDTKADQMAPLRGPRAPRPPDGMTSDEERDAAVLRLMAGEFRRLADTAADGLSSA